MASSESDQPEVIADVDDVEEQLKSISIRESSKTGKNIQDVSGKSQLDTSARSGKDSSDDLMSDVVDDGSTSNSETTSLHGHTTLLHGPEDHNCDVHAKGDNPVVSSVDATNTADVECRGNNNICAAGGSQPHTVTEEIVDDQPPILRSEESEEMDGKEGDGLETEDSGREDVRDEEKCEGNSGEEVIVTDGVTTDQVTQGDGAAPDTSAQFDPHCPPSSEQTCTVMHSDTKIDIHSSTSLLPADVKHDVDVEAEGTFGTWPATTTDLHIPAAASTCDGDEVRSSTKDAALNESAGETTSVMVGTKMNEESESEIISDTLLLQESQQPDYVPDTRDEVNVLCDSKVDALRILPVEEGKAKELVTESTTELKQTESSHTDKINISDSAKQIQSETLLTLDGFTPEKKIEEKLNACGEGELEEAVVGADSDVRPKSSSSVRSVSPGKCVRKRSGRGSRNPPGMGYSDLLRKTTEKSVDWEVKGEGEGTGEGEVKGEGEEQGGEDAAAGNTKPGKKNRKKKKRQNKDFPARDAADEEHVEQLQDFDDGSVDEDPGDLRHQVGRRKREGKKFNRFDRHERSREEDALVEGALAYFRNELDDGNSSRHVYYDNTGMSGKFMDDVDDDDKDDNEERYRIRNQRRTRGRGRGQVSDEGSRRGRGRGRARGSREFRRSRTDRSDSSSHSGQKPGEYSTQDVRRSHSESESSNQSMHMLEDSGSFETVQDRGFMNLTITATGDGTRHVETDCYSSFVNSVGAGGRRQDNKKKMNKKSSYGNQTREDERFQDVDDMHAQYQDRWYPEGGPREGWWEEQVDVPFKKKDKLKKHKKKDCGERDGNMTNFQYAEDSPHFVEGGFHDQDQKYDGDAASSDSHKIKQSRKQKKKQRYQKELQDRSKPSKDYGYSGRFHQFADITYEDNGQRERLPDDSEGQIVQQSPQKERKSHVEESDRGLADVERGVAPSPQGRSHQRRNNPRGSSRGGGGDSRRGGRGRNKSGHYPGDGPAPRWNDRYEQSPRSMSPRSSQGHQGEGNNLSGQHFQGKDYPSQQYQGHSGRDYPGRRNHPNHHAGARTGPPPNECHRGNRNRSDEGQGQNRSGKSSEGQQTSEGHQSHGQKDRRKWNIKTKQAKFEHHLSKEEVADGLKRGTLIEGPIRVNQRNYSEAYVPLPDGTADIYISGLNNRNRALNGDIVAVQLLDKQEWKVYVDDLQSKEAKVKPNRGQGEGDVARDDGSDSGPDVVVEEVMQISQEAKEKPQGENHKHKHATPRKTYTSLGEVMSQGSPQAKALMGGAGDQGDAGDGDKLLQRTGKVVAVVEAKHSRVSSGHIKLMQDRNRDFALFSPTDSRVPRIQVPMSECPKDFFERPDDHAKTLFIARITEWDNSMFAKGHLSRSLGEAGQIEPETEAILLEHNVESDDFPEEVLTCLPTSPWVIPESEFEYRQDLRRQCIFTIDPSTARDLDDAMSIEDLGNGSYKVGVHIADVSFFLDEGTPLDIKAASRATSVYLVQKVIPMLPRLLCEELCSLNPDKDRLTFSVFWTMDANGEIEDEWFGRTVIRSCVKCSYDHAQGFIENPDREWSQEELPPITNGFVVEDIRKRVLQLDKIAKCLRKKRFDSGALRLDQVKLTFALDNDTGMPNGYSVYEQRDSNRLIEEFMLLANMAVAHKIYKSYPQKAVLRRHPPPQSKMVDDLKDLCEQLGLPVDLSNSQTWQQSLSNYQGTDEFSAARMQVLVALSSKPMQNAKYFCSGMIADPEVYHHYALNVPLYTHFTSPIRRYADVLVHRLLATSLAYCRETSKDHRLLHKQADHCNDKKYMAKRVQEMSSEMFFAAFVKEVGPFEEKAMVMGVMDHSFDVFILKFGVSKRVYCDQLPLQSKTYIRDHKQPILTLVWAADDLHPQAAKQTLKIFTSVTICMMGDKRDPLKWKAILKRPTESC